MDTGPERFGFYTIDFIFVQKRIKEIVKDEIVIQHYIFWGDFRGSKKN